MSITPCPLHSPTDLVLQQYSTTTSFRQRTSSIQYYRVQAPSTGTFRSLVQAPVRPCTALVQYYRLLVLPSYFPNFLPLLLTHATYQVGFNINSTVSLVSVFAPHGGLWFESCRWYHVHQVPFSLFLTILSLHQCHDLSSGHVILSYI